MGKQKPLPVQEERLLAKDIESQVMISKVLEHLQMAYCILHLLLNRIGLSLDFLGWWDRVNVLLYGFSLCTATGDFGGFTLQPIKSAKKEKENKRTPFHP